MKQSYEKYSDEIADDILFKTGQAGDNGMRKSELDSYLNRIYKNKLGNQYDEYSFDTTAYFIYKRLRKEKLLEIRNNSAWIALTDEGRKAALQGYARYKSSLHHKKGRIKSVFTQFNLGASFLKNIIWIAWLVMLLLMLLDIIQKDSTIIKVLKFLK